MPDRITLAFRTLGFTLLLGAAVMTGFLLANRLMIHDLGPGGTPDVNQPAALMLVLGVTFTLMVPATLAWGLLAPLESAFRRGGLAMVSGLGSLALSMLAIPANQFFGIAGLVVMLAVTGAGAAVMGRKVALWSRGR